MSAEKSKPRRGGRRKMIDLTGRSFGRLTVISQAESQGTNIAWLCRCACGQEKVIRSCHLRSGKIRSCGCLYREVRGDANRTHGMSGSPEFYIWVTMNQRCTNPNNHKYGDYGGRGIKVCDRWHRSFQNFFADMGARPSTDHSIDRIDVNGNYEPGNCRWATRKEQANNKRRNSLKEPNG